jgi:uncharacterized protein (TIGR03437 family)
LLPAAAFTQPPIVQASGVLNAASLLSTTAQGISPGMLLTIKGQLLAASAAVGTYENGALPVRLAGTQVTINGIAAPLLYVSQTQINLQVPLALQTGKDAEILVSTAAGSSSPVTVPAVARAFGVFTQDASGCGAGSVLNVHADGTLSVNSTENSFDPLHDAAMALFMNGLGRFADLQDGAPWQYNAGDNVASGGSSPVITPFYGTPGNQTNQALGVLYAGPAPGTVGVDQLNIAPLQPSQLFESCHVPLYVASDSGVFSQVVTVSVQDGGGSCARPTATSLGLVTWQKNSVVSASGTVSSDGIAVQFLGGQQVTFPTPVQVGIVNCCEAAPITPLNCQAAPPTALNAGTLAITGVTANAITIAPQVSAGQISYRATLPPGTLAGGSYGIAASGGPDVGAFSASASVPPAISITNPPSPGSALTLPYQLTWTGGDSNSVIDVQLRVSTSQGLFVLELAPRATAGELTIPASLGFPMSLIPVPHGRVELVVTQGTQRQEMAYFSAPGLSLGGEQLWSYVWDFQGLAY